MMNILILFSIILIGKNLSSIGTTSLNDTIKKGDFANGGIVFKVDSTGQHGLICSKEDQIRNIHWNDVKNIAIKVCQDYSLAEGTEYFDDWYLPNKEELYFMYVNKTIIDSTAVANGGSVFAENNELSSTEYCNSPSWDQVFNYGYQNYDYKNSLLNVRAVRKF